MPFAFDGFDRLEPAFEDRPVPYISYGSRFHLLAAQHASETVDAKRVFIIVSAGLNAKAPQALKRLHEALATQNVEVVGTHVGMKPHTHWTEVVSIANEAKPLNPDCIITLGAGSITDGSKVIAWMLANDITTAEQLDTMWGSADPTSTTKPSPNPKQKAYPAATIRIIAVPTSLSGGEYQNLAGVTRDHDGSNRKCPFYPPPRNPSLIVLDPELVATTTPEHIWLSSGVRAVDHCIETLCSLRSNEKADESAEQGLKRLIPNLILAKHDAHGHNLDARFGAMLGVRDAMSAVGQGVPMGASHAIGHQLGPLGVGHGETSCIMLPAVCKYNAKHKANVDRQDICRTILLRDPVVKNLIQQKNRNENDLDLGDLLDLIIRELGLPRSLNHVGIGQDKMDVLAENSLTDRWIGTNALPITEKAQVMEILEMVVQ